MFTLNEIKELIHLVDESSIDELEIEHDESRLLIRKSNKTQSVLMNTTPMQQSYVPYSQPTVQPTPAVDTPVVQAQTEMENANLHKIVSPMVGTFYHAPTPEASAFVKQGDKVKVETVVCIVEAMKLMNEIEAEIKGEIVEIMVENGQLVEYGQTLFLVKPE